MVGTVNWKTGAEDDGSDGEEYRSRSPIVNARKSKCRPKKSALVLCTLPTMVNHCGEEGPRKTKSDDFYGEP